MASKYFDNKTGYDLSVMLTVRHGDTPGSDLAPVNFTLDKGAGQSISYGDDSNPYLDGIAVNAVDRGNIIASQQFVITRGSSIDNDMNTNDHIAFALDDDAMILQFSNG